MASFAQSGSPTPRKRQVRTNFNIHEDSPTMENNHLSGSPWIAAFDNLTIEQHSSSTKQGASRDSWVGNGVALPLTTSYLANQNLPITVRKSSVKKPHIDLPDSLSSVNVDPTDHLGDTSTPMKQLLAKLSERQAFLAQQNQTAPVQKRRDTSHTSASPAGSDQENQPWNPSGNIRPDSSEGLIISPDEVAQLKRELEQAQTRIARMDHELYQSRASQSDQDPENLRGSSAHVMPGYQGWSNQNSTDQARVPTPLDPLQAIWGPGFGFPMDMPSSMPPNNPSVYGGPAGLSAPGDHIQRQQPTYGGSASNNLPKLHIPQHDINQISRPGSAFGIHPQPWQYHSGGPANHSGSVTPLTPFSVAPSPRPFDPSMGQGFDGPIGHGYMPKPIGSRLSPTAVEFSSGPNALRAYSPWNMPPPTEAQPSYMSTTEPMNYRRLLDKNMSCNWKYIVDKIVCSNDQQASIFLQQKLKVGTSDQKFEIVQAIIDQAYPLMVNRFGNFLVQRCFEHGSPEQIIAIARAIRGNTLNLSMDAFGCHVVQKAFDSVPEEYKAIMVHELLRRIPETVIHRYACHVWQKLFELRWNGSPPQIMKYVNEALRGMWHEVALGETGSLVVQNIFENCLEDDKRPCINEVLASIDVVAHGQFGNWCVQHICEHGTIPDRTRAIDHVLRFATEYSMDQFASKVVEKCLKIGGNDFLDRYLDRVCEARADRPRMPLIDIAGDQFGNYLIQYVLTQAEPQRRETVASHIRKHMVSLRGSKYGSRVAILCCNPALATRPGPPTGMAMPRQGPSGGNNWPERADYSDRPYAGSRGGPYGGGYR